MLKRRSRKSQRSCSSAERSFFAIQTARDEVAVGIATRKGAWHNVVQAASAVADAAQAVKAVAALAFVDGPAQNLGLQEIRVLDAERIAGRGRGPGGGDSCGADGAKFLGKPDAHQVTGLGIALD